MSVSCARCGHEIINIAKPGSRYDYWVHAKSRLEKCGTPKEPVMEATHEGGEK